MRRPVVDLTEIDHRMPALLILKAPRRGAETALQGGDPPLERLAVTQIRHL